MGVRLQDAASTTKKDESMPVESRIGDALLSPAELVNRFRAARVALTLEFAGAVDALAALALEALAQDAKPLAAACAGMTVLAEHVIWEQHCHMPRMLTVLSATGPESAVGADALCAWAGAAVAHDYGELPTWPAPDFAALLDRLGEAPPDIALALGCALGEVCERNGRDADFAALRAKLAGVELRAGASPFWRGHWSIVCAWHLVSFAKIDEALVRLEGAQTLAATHDLRSLGANAALQRARLIECHRDSAKAMVLANQALARGHALRTPLWWADEADVRCRIALHERDFHAAVGHARRAMGFVQVAAVWPACHVTYRANEAYALLGTGAFDEALACFEAIVETSLPRHLTQRAKCLAELTMLSAADRRGQWDASQQSALIDVLRRLRELEWPSVLPLLPDYIARLFARALASGIEVDWVCAAIRTRKLFAPKGAPAAWPWSVTVRALGAFEVTTDSGPLRQAAHDSRKAASKPLELLRYLAAHGHDAVPVDVVAEALWPGDRREGRHKAFEITVARLRRLLHSDVAIAVSDRRVRLNAHCVWVDVQACNDRLAECETPIETAIEGSRTVRAALDAALALYRAPLLQDSQESWAATARERVRARLGAALLRAMRWPETSALLGREWTLRAGSADPEVGRMIG